MNTESKNKENLESITKRTWNIQHKLKSLMSYCNLHFESIHEVQDKLIDGQSKQKEDKEEILKIIISMEERIQRQEISHKEEIKRLERVIATQEETIMSLSSRMDWNL